MKRLCLILIIIALVFVSDTPVSALNQGQLRLDYTPDSHSYLHSISGSAFFVEVQSTKSGIALHEAEIYMECQGGFRVTVEIILRHREGNKKELSVGYYIYFKHSGAGVLAEYSEEFPAQYGIQYDWRVYRLKGYVMVEVCGAGEKVFQIVLAKPRRIYRVSMSLEYAAKQGLKSDARFTIKEVDGKCPVGLLIPGQEVRNEVASIGYGINSLNYSPKYFYNRLAVN